MKLSILSLGLALLNPLTASVSHAGDCMEVAAHMRQDLEEAYDSMKDMPSFPSSNDNSGYVSSSYHMYAAQHQIYVLNDLIDLYSNANEEKCEGKVKEIYDALIERSQKKRIKKSKRKEFEAPTCETLMARIDRGRTGEFCPHSKTGKYNVEKIKTVIEKENRKRKK